MKVWTKTLEDDSMDIGSLLSPAGFQKPSSNLKLSGKHCGLVSGHAGYFCFCLRQGLYSPGQLGNQVSLCLRPLFSIYFWKSSTQGYILALWKWKYTVPAITCQWDVEKLKWLSSNSVIQLMKFDMKWTQNFYNVSTHASVSGFLLQCRFIQCRFIIPSKKFSLKITSRQFLEY